MTYQFSTSKKQLPYRLKEQIKFLNGKNKINFYINPLLEKHHLLNSNTITGFYKEKLKDIYYQAIDNYFNNNLKNSIYLFKNNKTKYQFFEINNLKYIDTLQIFILIDNSVQNEYYASIMNHDNDDLFVKNVFQKKNKNGIIKNIYSILIEWNEKDIQRKFDNYNLGALYHEFTHIFQCAKNNFIIDNISNGVELSDILLTKYSGTNSLSLLDDSDLMNEIKDKKELSLKDLIYILGCLVYYCDYSERAAYLQSVQAEIRTILKDI